MRMAPPKARTCRISHRRAAASTTRSNNRKPRSALPRIFQKEARRVSRPLLYEQKSGFAVKQKTLHEMLAGVDELPPIKGYVLTSKKDNPLVETVLFATKPGGEDNTTILAGWNYGLGRAVAFTTDAGLAWTSDWPNRPVYDKLFGQVIRWSMRPSGSSGKFTTTFEPREGRMRVVDHGLGQQRQVPQLPHDVRHGRRPRLEESDPGGDRTSRAGPLRRQLAVHDPGSYFVTINPGRGMTPLRTGVTVPYSAEFRDRGPNEALLTQLAAARPKDGPPGRDHRGQALRRNPGKSCTRSIPSATICRRPAAARRSGTGCSCWRVASSWATCSFAA